MARGGRRTPADPAPVSGPGALSQRTDGGPGQPTRSFPAESYGQRQQLEQLQGAAPMSAGGGGAPQQSSGGSGPPSLPPGVSLDGILGPTQFPNEPVDTSTQPKVLAPNPDALLDAIYAVYPHPDIANLRRR